MNLRVTLHSSSGSGALVLAVKHRIEKYIYFLKSNLNCNVQWAHFLNDVTDLVVVRRQLG